MTPTTYSIVVPLYNTERYLPDLLDALERQSGRGTAFEMECIFIDDSSPDRAARLAETWLKRTGIRGEVVHQPNGGVSSARNNGLDRASGEWITFIDSDDFINDDYVRNVDRYLREIGDRRDDVALVSCNVARYNESNGAIDYAHPLSQKFNRGDQVYDLTDAPEFIQSQAASAFFSVARLRASGVRFLEGLHAAEDAIFVATFLLAQDRPVIACVADAVYLYRRRASGDSAVDMYKTSRDFYFDRFSRGYLPLFQAAAADGGVPQWLGQYFLYDMRWFFPRELNVKEKATHLTADERATVLGLVRDVMMHIEPQWILDYSITGLSFEIRNVFLGMIGGELATAGYVRAASRDAFRDLICLSYYFAGEVPEETITVGTRPVEIVASKVRHLDYLDQEFVHERIIWVRAEDALGVALDGVTQHVLTGGYPAPQLRASRRRMGFDGFIDPTALPHAADVGRPLPRRIAGRARRELAALVPKAFEGSRYHGPGMDIRERRETKAVQVYAQRPSVRERYENAWIFLDRISAGDDNAEALYRHVRQHRPDINAYFVIRKDSSHWDRLKESGVRLIEYGSTAHKAALMYADFVISSHLDVEIVNQIPDRFYWRGRKPWRFVYLQHGVMQHNLSHWFNRKPIDLITTASVDEHASIVDDDTSYQLTTLQAKMTGFPRHDAMVRGKRAAEGRPRRLVLLAPTWRHNMEKNTAPTADGRPFSVDFASSEYARNWFGLLNDPRLHAIADEHDLELAFLPHPNFRNKIPDGLLSDRVRMMRSVPDMTELLLQAKVVVTDYSSIFFDAAIAGADISYFQFDRDDYLHGGHIYVPGYWSYEKHGFGPVALDVDGMIDVLAAQLDPERTAEFDEYRARVTRTLPNLDGDASSRVLQEILDLD